MGRSSLVHIVALSSAERAEQARVCYSLGNHAEIYGSYDEFVAAAPTQGVVLAEDLPDCGGVRGLLGRMADQGFWLPVVRPPHPPPPHPVCQTIQAGAPHLSGPPFDQPQLADTLARTSEEAETFARIHRQACEARVRLARLTQREREVLDRLVSGLSNKCIARDLQISPRTVEIHRAHMMSKLGAAHAADAVRLRLEAGMVGAPGAVFREAPLKAA